MNSVASVNLGDSASLASVGFFDHDQPALPSSLSLAALGLAIVLLAQKLRLIPR